MSSVPEAAASRTADAELLAAVIEQAPTPLWVIAADGGVELVNQAAVMLLGYSAPGDLIGRPSHRTLHERRPDGSEYPQDACPILGPTNPRPRTGAEWFTARSGRPLPVVWSARALGRNGATLLSFEDASDRLAAERQRCRWNRQLVTRGADATVTPTRSALRDQLIAQVHERFRDPEFSVADLAGANHLSVRSVQVLLAEVGRSPADEIRTARLEFARRLLEQGSAVRSACYDSGFSDPGTFARAFRRHFDHSPTELLRREGAGPGRER